MYQQDFQPTLDELTELFRDEIAAARGKMTGIKRRNRLFVRATLPLAEDVLPGDKINAGVAMRVVDEQVSIHPYTFRQVCKNGAIAADVLCSMRIQRASGDATPYDLAQISDQVVAAIAACTAPEVFSGQIRTMRQMAASPLGSATEMVALLAQLGELAADPELAETIMDHFLRRESPSLYGLMNAITATARDCEDPDLKWQLEEFGCGIGARLLAASDSLSSRV